MRGRRGPGWRAAGVTSLAAVAWSSLALPAGAAERALRVWLAGSSEPLVRAVNDVLKPRFEASAPNVRLEVEFIPWGELSTKLVTAFAGGVGPDVFMHGQAATAGFAASGLVAPLDDWLRRLPDAADFRATLDAGAFLGQRYMLPLYGSGQLLAYCVDCFLSAGLDPEKPPANWDELVRAARLLARFEGQRLVREGLDLPVRGTDAQQVWSSFLWQNGGELLSADGRSVAFASPAGFEALRFYAAVVQDERIGAPEPAQASGNLPGLAAGTTAMSFLALEALNNIRRFAPEVFAQIRVAPPLERRTKAAWYSFAGLFVSARSREPELARSFLAFMARPESLRVMVEALGGLPPRVSMAQSPVVTANPAAVAFVQGLAHARFNPNHPKWVQVRDILVRQIERAALAQLSPEQALAQAEREANGLLREP